MNRSLGEKLLRIASSVSRLESREFVAFLEMFFTHDSPPSIRFYESSPFLWPSFLDLSQPLSDSTRNLLRFCISPAVLSIGFSKKGKQANPSFELYHPAVFARQFGFGQAVPKLILTERLRIRDRIKSRRLADFALSQADDLLLRDLPPYRLYEDSSADFDAWWVTVCEDVFPETLNIAALLDLFGIELPEGSAVERSSGDTSTSGSDDSDRSSSQVANCVIADKFLIPIF